jgi:hypothetical protein
MKSYPAPKTPQFLVDSVRQMAADGTTHEEMIAKMRAAGLSIAPSIMLLSQATGLPVNEAKRMVHFSSTWRDCLAANDALHEAAIEAVKRLGDEVVERDAEPSLQMASK